MLLAGRQTIEKLQPEPKIQERAKAGSFQWIEAEIPAEMAEKVVSINNPIIPKKGTIVFEEHPLPPDIADKVATIGRPQLYEQNAQSLELVNEPNLAEALSVHYMEQIAVLDHCFMENYEKEDWIEPLNTAISIAVGEVSPIDSIKSRQN